MNQDWGEVLNVSSVSVCVCVNVLVCMRVCLRPHCPYGMVESRLSNPVCQ